MPALGLHADQNWMPAPFPEHNLCSLLHFMRRHDSGRAPPPSYRISKPPASSDERRAENPVTIPIEVEKDPSLYGTDLMACLALERFWDSHGFTPLQRLYTQPIDDYVYLLEDEEYVANASQKY